MLGAGDWIKAEAGLEAASGDWLEAEAGDWLEAEAGDWGLGAG